MAKAKIVEIVPVELTWKEEYANYIKSKEWKVKRLEILNHYKNKCMICGSTSVLCAHHIDYENFKNETTHDLVCLCRSCHSFAHDGRIQIIRTTEDELRKIADIFYLFNNKKIKYVFVSNGANLKDIVFKENPNG